MASITISQGIKYIEFLWMKMKSDRAERPRIFYYTTEIEKQIKLKESKLRSGKNIDICTKCFTLCKREVLAKTIFYKSLIDASDYKAIDLTAASCE